MQEGDKSLTYRGFDLVYAPINVPGGNRLDYYKIVGTNVHASWPQCKAAIDKVKG